jgi:hypothetical protein
MRTLTPLATAAALTAAVACVHAEAPTMKPDDRSAHVETALATLDTSFKVDGGRRVLRVEYSVKNTSSAPLMVLDAGVAIGGKLAAGGAAPLGKTDGEALTLTHAATALPKPAPTVPRITLASRLEPGAMRSSKFDADVPPGVKRVRYCVGVAPFAEDAFAPFEPDTKLWRAAFGVAATQTLICTAWFDLATNHFSD